MQNITQVTRRDIADAVVAEKVDWSGRLEEPDFLNRLFDLNTMPSNDRRYENAAGDVWKHRIANNDWEDDWVFYDDRFNLLNGDDDLFLRFLCETIHPVVRSDSVATEKLLQLYNSFLISDGYRLVEKTRISGRSVYVGRFVGIVQTPGVAAAQAVLAATDPGYVAQQITRMEAAVNNDPDLAIGTAKELVESCCKTILAQCSVDIPNKANLPKLTKLAVKQLALTPDDIPDKAKAAETIKRLLSNLATITQGVAELRNHYGTGHGKGAGTKGLSPRHAKLAVGAASTLAVFLIETHQHKSGSKTP
ncbi:MAG: abortive infection family protein [Bacteroidota bacterium]